MPSPFLEHLDHELGIKPRAYFSSLFETEPHRIPLRNLREEFRLNFEFVVSARFAATGCKLEPIETPIFIWLGMPSDLATRLVQQAVVGLEAYVPAAVNFEATERGVHTEDLARFCREPVQVPGPRASLQEKRYNRLPALVDPALAMNAYDSRLFDLLDQFYRRIRNPIFHGSWLPTPYWSCAAASYRLIALAYEWVDSWFPPEERLGTLGKGLRISLL